MRRVPTPGGSIRWLDFAAKTVLAGFLVVVVVDPTWGNLEGKAPVARAVTYPLLAGAVPLLWWCFLRPRPFPWVPDLLVTLACFSDILGNRLDLYDRLVWFDDWMHFANNFLLAAAVVLLTLDQYDGLAAHLERAIAFATTAALAWELFEYASFLTRSTELPMAYTDTLGDLTLGWLGAAIAAVVVHAGRAAHPRTGVVEPPHLVTPLRPRSTPRKSQAA